MRRIILFIALAAIGLANTGCFMNAYPSDPQLRIRALLNESENLRQVEGEMMRFWMVDQPSHLTPDRVHGGMGP